MFIGFFAWKDILWDNGYRKIYEQQIDDNQYFCVYRTPDKGAFGGDWIEYTIDNKLILGFVRRRELRTAEYEIHQNIPDGINTITYQGHTITYKTAEVWHKGDLK